MKQCFVLVTRPFACLPLICPCNRISTTHDLGRFLKPTRIYSPNAISVSTNAQSDGFSRELGVIFLAKIARRRHREVSRELQEMSRDSEMVPSTYGFVSSQMHALHFRCPKKIADQSLLQHTHIIIKEEYNATDTASA